MGRRTIRHTIDEIEGAEMGTIEWAALAGCGAAEQESAARQSTSSKRNARWIHCCLASLLMDVELQSASKA